MIILYYNVRSLLPKFDELLLQVNSLHPDIVALQSLGFPQRFWIQKLLYLDIMW